MNSRNKCSGEFIAVKTDISKAYDRVEWAFLDRAMKSLGFSDRWCSVMMKCVTSVKYQVLINGTPYGDIKPSRGLRQGDPLSPYLFVLCTEILVQMIKKAEEKQLLSGLKVARGAPAVSHLLYADDSLFYCRRTYEEIHQLTQILQKYSLVSGQRVNYQKSSIYFGKHMSEERKETIKTKLGIQETGGEGVYLGLPESFGGSRVSILNYLKERISQKVQGWQMRFLSPGGKEVMLKSIAMALPTYTMSCFLLPKTLCRKIVATMADYWWRNKRESRGMHWKSWDQLTKPKAVGDLGFRDLEAFNLALLGKQLWRMATCPESLLARIYRSRYYANSDPFTASLGSRPSYAWRSIHAAQRLMKQGARVIIGNGQQTNVWREQWVQRKPARGIQQTKPSLGSSGRTLSIDMTVAELMINGTTEWNKDLLQEVFPAEEVRLIENIKPGGKESADNYCWKYTKTGLYSVKSEYWVQKNVIEGSMSQVQVSQPSLDSLYKAIWQTKTSPKIQHFLWKCLSDALPTAENLAYRHIAKDARCPRCEDAAESTNHLLFQCPYARLVWALSPIKDPKGGVLAHSLFSNIYHVLQNHRYPDQDGGNLELGPWILWRLWKKRNEYIFQGQDYDGSSTVQKAIEDAREWRSRNDNPVAKDTKVKAPSNSHSPKTWKPPREQWVKCNVDGSWNHNQDNGGVGWISRNRDGRLLWAGAKKMQGLGSAIETEAEAIRWAIHTMVNFGYSNVIVESDSQVLVRKIKGEEPIWPRLQPIIQNITQTL